MANEIKYQINGQLSDNTVTVDNKEDMILVPRIHRQCGRKPHHCRTESGGLRSA